MANYTAADIKAIRESTGAGMLDVKKALDEANGDSAKAVELIRVKGLKGIAKREGRTASEGLIAVDVRGHGRSDRPESGVDMTRRGRDVRDVIETLGLDGAVLIGASMGGNTVWFYLEQFGAARVGAVVIVDQTPKMLNTPDWPHGYYGYDESNVDTFFAAGVRPTGRGTPLAKRGLRLVRLLRVLPSGGERELTPGQLVLLQDHAHRDWRPVIARTEVPVLFVAGAESELWPSSHARAAAALAPQGRSAVIRRDGHATNMEQPAAFNRGVLAFLDEVAPPRV